jgi:hypothetical protein
MSDRHNYPALRSPPYDAQRSSPENVDKKENRSGACRFGFCFVFFDFELIYVLRFLLWSRLWSRLWSLLRFSLSTIVTILRKVFGKLLLNPTRIIRVMFKLDR